MTISSLLSYAAAYFGVTVAAAVLLRDQRSFVHRIFAAGMIVLSAEEFLRGIVLGSVLPEDILYWQKRVLAISACVPAVWLAFSLSYARANSEKVLAKWKWGMIAAGVVPAAFVVIFRHSIFSGNMTLVGQEQWTMALSSPGKVLEAFFLCACVLILFNLERTIRSSIGRMRWQIKFMALGVGGLFALRLYIASQSLLYSTLDTGFGAINAVAMLAACVLFAISLTRGRSLNVDVYLSTATIQNSLTIMLAGIYLLAVGALARAFRSRVQPDPAPGWDHCFHRSHVSGRSPAFEPIAEKTPDVRRPAFSTPSVRLPQRMDGPDRTNQVPCGRPGA